MNPLPLTYHLVDVFTDQPFGGNQLAVFPNGDEVPEEWMQKIARELNLSETTFVTTPQEPGADFRVRIFTPTRELPMAGHPSVGTAYVLARLGRIATANPARVLFQEGVGPIPMEICFRNGEPDTIFMDQLRPQFGPAFEDRRAIAEMLSLDLEDILPGLPLEAVSCGLPFLLVPLRRLEAVQKINLKNDRLEALLGEFAAPNVLAFSLETEHPSSTVHCRVFAPLYGVQEDPATGSANGPLGAYLVHHGLVEGEGAVQIRSEQGLEMGRPSFLDIEIYTAGEKIDRVRIGGGCVYMGSGNLTPAALRDGPE